MRAVGETFPVLLNIPIAEDVNEIIIGVPHKRDSIRPVQESHSHTTPIGSQSHSDPKERSMKLDCSASIRDAVSSLARTIAASDSNVHTEIMEYLQNAVFVDL